MYRIRVSELCIPLALQKPPDVRGSSIILFYSTLRPTTTIKRFWKTFKTSNVRLYKWCAKLFLFFHVSKSRCASYSWALEIRENSALSNWCRSRSECPSPSEFFSPGLWTANTRITQYLWGDTITNCNASGEGGEVRLEPHLWYRI
jgi:hypothetical protein